MRSFDISSLSTCVPLIEAINICVDALYRSLLPYFRDYICRNYEIQTISVEFSFDGVMHRQTGGVSTGPLWVPFLLTTLLDSMKKDYYLILIDLMVILVTAETYFVSSIAKITWTYYLCPLAISIQLLDLHKKRKLTSPFPFFRYFGSQNFFGFSHFSFYRKQRLLVCIPVGTDFVP